MESSQTDIVLDIPDDNVDVEGQWLYLTSAVVST